MSTKIKDGKIVNDAQLNDAATAQVVRALQDADRKLGSLIENDMSLSASQLKSAGSALRDIQNAKRKLLMM